jgi:propionyl-CoA carboxylase beta chain
MGSKHLGADVNLAWPTAEIAVMGAEGAVSVLHRTELAEAGDDAPQLRDKLVTEYRDTMLNPYLAAERGYLDAVIAPAETRRHIGRALWSLRGKRRGDRHGNIPL